MAKIHDTNLFFLQRLECDDVVGLLQKLTKDCHLGVTFESGTTLDHPTQYWVAINLGWKPWANLYDRDIASWNQPLWWTIIKWSPTSLGTGLENAAEETNPASTYLLSAGACCPRAKWMSAWVRIQEAWVASVPSACSVMNSSVSVSEGRLTWSAFPTALLAGQMSGCSPWTSFPDSSFKTLNILARREIRVVITTGSLRLDRKLRKSCFGKRPVWLLTGFPPALRFCPWNVGERKMDKTPSNNSLAGFLKEKNLKVWVHDGIPFFYINILLLNLN